MAPFQQRCELPSSESGRRMVLKRTTTRTHELVTHTTILNPFCLNGASCCLLSVTAGIGALEVDMEMLEDLESLRFEFGIPEEERYWLYLQGRYRGLMIKGCAHAAFFCKMFSTLR